MIESIEELDRLVLARLDDGRGQCASSGSCRYRDGTGNACSIGALIPDELYSEEIENFVLSNLTIEENKFISGDWLCKGEIKLANILNEIIATPSYEMLNRMRTWQSRHDRGVYWEGNKYIGPRD